MFIEMGVLQQCSRFMRHPILAFAFVLALMLTASGLGALKSSSRKCALPRPPWIVCGLGVVHVALWRTMIRTGHPGLFAADLAVIASMAFFMGMPFPQAIAAIRSRAPALVPWAWAVNGFVSVLAVLLAGLLCLSLGLTAICCLGAAAYLLAAVVWKPCEQT
jgi:hypothetical protein